MQAIKTIRGYEVRFIASMRDQLKLVDVMVIGGGCGPALTWIEAWEMAHEMVGYAIERDLCEAATAARKESERLARVAKHEAKQKRRAPAQSLKAKLAAITG